ncbi:Hypothetical protein A7982_07093 [Minicystis rosea]|nr:Hypothetical protein A7982_07093 [Minicystis rosea]
MPARRQNGWGVFALIGVAVLSVNLVTDGEAITARIDQVSALVDDAAALVQCQVSRLTRCDDDRTAAVEPNGAPRCHRAERSRRGHEGWPAKMVVRRRWSCRA